MADSNVSDPSDRVSDRRDLPFGLILRRDVDSDPFRALSGSSIRVYAALLTFANRRDGRAWPSRRTLARITGLSETTVSRGVTGLVTTGFVRIESRGRGNMYILISPVDY